MFKFVEILSVVISNFLFTCFLKSTKYVYGNRVADCETATRIQRRHFPPDLLPSPHVLQISFLSHTPRLPDFQQK